MDWDYNHPRCLNSIILEIRWQNKFFRRKLHSSLVFPGCWHLCASCPASPASHLCCLCRQMKTINPLPLSTTTVRPPPTHFFFSQNKAAQLRFPHCTQPLHGWVSATYCWKLLTHGFFPPGWKNKGWEVLGKKCQAVWRGENKHELWRLLVEKKQLKIIKL